MRRLNFVVCTKCNLRRRRAARFFFFFACLFVHIFLFISFCLFGPCIRTLTVAMERWNRISVICGRSVDFAKKKKKKSFRRILFDDMNCVWRICTAYVYISSVLNLIFDDCLVSLRLSIFFFLSIIGGGHCTVIFPGGIDRSL